MIEMTNWIPGKWKKKEKPRRVSGNGPGRGVHRPFRL